MLHFRQNFMHKYCCSCKRSTWHQWPCTDAKMHSTESITYGGYIRAYCKSDTTWDPKNECTMGNDRRMCISQLLNSLLGCLISDLSAGSNSVYSSCYSNCGTTHVKVGGIARFICNTGFFLESNVAVGYYDPVCQADGSWADNGLNCVKSRSIIEFV